MKLILLFLLFCSACGDGFDDSETYVNDSGNNNGNSNETNNDNDINEDNDISNDNDLDNSQNTGN